MKCMGFVERPNLETIIFVFRVSDGYRTTRSLTKEQPKPQSCSTVKCHLSSGNSYNARRPHQIRAGWYLPLLAPLIARMSIAAS